MGALLALPELIAAAVEGGAEALAIAGSEAAIASGEGAAVLEGLGAGSEVLIGGEELGVSAAAQTVLTQTPEVVNTLTAIQGGVQAGTTLAAGVVSYLQPGDLSAEAASTSGGGRPGGYNNPSTKTTQQNMALQLLPPNQLEHGVPGIPDWILNLVPDVPSLQDIFYRIANGILTSYYHTGRAIVQRTVSEEMQRLLDDLSRGFASTLEAIGQSDPVSAIVEQVQNMHTYFRHREMLLLEGGDPIPVGQIASRAGSVASSAIGSAVDTIRNVVVDVANLPSDGFNALSEGVHRLGQWIQFGGPDGGTIHYSTPQWILYVLQELERELPKIPQARLKRKADNNVQGDMPKKKARARKSTCTKTTKSNKKRRCRSTGNSATRTRVRVQT